MKKIGFYPVVSREEGLEFSKTSPKWVVVADPKFEQGLSRFYGVMVSTLDSESSDPSSSLGRTFIFYTM